jgi:hypothetical protein
VEPSTIAGILNTGRMSHSIRFGIADELWLVWRSVDQADFEAFTATARRIPGDGAGFMRGLRLSD